MRTDEVGNTCPATWGEYYDLCLMLGGVATPALWWLETKIARCGRNEHVPAPDSKMRYLLLPLLHVTEKQ